MKIHILYYTNQLCFFLLQKKDGAAPQVTREKNGHANNSKPKTNGAPSSFAGRLFAFQTPCFLPAVTDFDEPQKKAQAQYEDSNGGQEIRNSYISNDSSLRNRAFVSNQTKSWCFSKTTQVCSTLQLEILIQLSPWKHHSDNLSFIAITSAHSFHLTFTVLWKSVRIIIDLVQEVLEWNKLYRATNK